MFEEPVRKKKRGILDLEKKFNFKDKDSPSKTLGFTPSKNFEKYPHRVKMLSLSNAFDEEDLINFEKIYYNLTVSKLLI